MLSRMVTDSISRYVLSLPAVYYRVAEPDPSCCWLYSHYRTPTLADVLDRLMERAGWSRSQLARQMGTTPQTVSRILSGLQKGLTPEILRNLRTAAMPYPDIYDTLASMTIRGPGRPPVVQRF